MSAADPWGFDGKPEREPQAKPNGHAPPPPLDPITPFSWPDLAGRNPPPRQFIVAEWIPRACVTSLYGPGGIGKSLLAQQLATSVATGAPWLGLETTQCRVLGLFCEDDEHELWRRQASINAAAGLDMSKLHDFAPDARPGRENALAWAEQYRLVAAPLLDELRTKVASEHYGLVILDNIAQMFAGSENDRAQVTAFVNLLAGIARDHDCAVVLLGHVAKAEGSQFSGSTAWDAAVRSRLLLKRIESEDDAEPKLRLSKVKSNYSKQDSIELIWRDGVIRPADPRFMTSADVLDAKCRDGEVQQKFLDALDKLRSQGRTASHNKQAGNYAPKMVRELGLNGGCSEAELVRAMNALLDDGRIRADAPVLRNASRHWRTGLARPQWAHEPSGAH